MSEQDVDIVKAEITRNALQSAAVEMNTTLVRSAYNPLIFDVKDFGVGVMSADGDLWADAPGLPVFTGVLPASVKSGLAKWGRDGIHDGDVFVVNSPYLNGTHISDTAVYMPVFHGGRLVAFTGSMAHWADVGGMSPGGWTVNSTEIYQEGIAFTHQRLLRRGEVNEDVFDLIAENMRVPQTVMGDLWAQIATARTGAERVQQLCDRYGADEVEALMAHVIASTERALRREVAAMPDGVLETGFRFDFSGVDREEVPVVRIRTTISGDRVEVSFEGTSKQSSGPINAGEQAVRATVAEALKGVLDPLGTANQAHLELADIVWPSTPSLVNPVKPAPCDSYGYLMTGVIETMQQSFAEVAPDRVRAGGYQMVSTYVMSTRGDAEDAYVFAEPVQGGHGAFPGRDGACMMFVTDGDCSNTPVEVLELRFPVRCDAFALETAHSGAGEFRGGAGVRRDLRVLQTGSMTKTASESTVDPIALGVRGGLTGAPTHVELVHPDGTLERVDERIVDRPVAVGTVVRQRTGGGGGFGSPTARDPHRVACDVRDERITLEQAADLYRVALVPGTLPGTWDVDDEATAALRASAREHIASARERSAGA
ncbi:MAG: hydantoinase B/oxoprolinase family protein [Quadrisphaera sp.]